MSFLVSQFENKEVAGGELGGLVTTLVRREQVQQHYLQMVAPTTNHVVYNSYCSE